VLLDNPYNFDSVDEVYATQHDSTLGSLFADAYKWAAEKATGETIDVALTASGVIRETIPQGNVTVSDVFNAASLGVGTEGELIKVYIKGKDLRTALEVDASVQPLMKAAQLYFAGTEYSFNTYRMIFNKVDNAYILRADGTKEAIDDNKTYSVVTGMYVGQMLGSVKEKSFGLLTITPMDKDGNALEADELVNHVIRDENGRPLKEWNAISEYLKTMNGEMDEKYSKPDGRKTVYSSLAPWDMLRNPNLFTFIALGIILLLILIIVLIVRAIVRKIKRKKGLLPPKKSRKAKKNQE
jgi:2',3'-cyclic-nucleotide 2'-phosphodiesterase (5'-nucleotidase family)